MKTISIILVFLLASCAVDYRTDYERNNGIVLTEEQIQGRKEIREYYGDQTQRAMKRDMDEFVLQRAYRDCGNRSIVACL